MIRIKRPVPPSVIGSSERLAAVLDESVEVLEKFREPSEARYVSKEIPKADGRSSRPLQVPCFSLKRLQRKINSRILQTVSFPSYVYGGIRGTSDPRDYVACAKRHAGSKVISKLDIDDFFTNVAHAAIQDIFRSFFCYPDEVSELLADLSSYDREYLPQGAPTSPAIANLSFYDDEHRIVSYLENLGITYTRFLDDIVLSSPYRKCQLGKAERRVQRMLEDHNFSLNEEKWRSGITDIAGAEIFGLRINFPEPRLRKAEVRQIRHEVRLLEAGCRIPNERVTTDYDRKWHRSSGLVGKMTRLRHPNAQRFRKRLRRIMPLVHPRERLI